MSDSPWFSLYASDFLAGTACMEPDELERVAKWLYSHYTNMRELI